MKSFGAGRYSKGGFLDGAKFDAAIGHFFLAQPQSWHGWVEDIACPLVSPARALRMDA